jgi:hypothetical protein
MATPRGTEVGARIFSAGHLQHLSSALGIKEGGYLGTFFRLCSKTNQFIQTVDVLQLQAIIITLIKPQINAIFAKCPSILN